MPTRQGAALDAQRLSLVDGRQHPRRTQTGATGLFARCRRQQLAGVVVARAGEHLRHRPGVDHHAVVHHVDAVGDLRHQCQVVADNQQPGAAGHAIGQNRDHLLLHGHIQGGRRFVGDDQARLASDGGTDQCPLAQATGELMGILSGALPGFGDADLREDLDHPLFHLATALEQVVHGEDFARFLADGAQWVQRHQRILHHQPGPATADLAPVPLGEGQGVATGDLQGPGLDHGAVSGQAQQAARGQALARAGFAHQGHAFAGLDTQAQTAHQRRITLQCREADAQVVDVYQGLGHGASLPSKRRCR